MSDVVQFAWGLLGMVGTAGAIYGGIRSDLRHLREKAADAHARAEQAHTRIDSLLFSARD